MFYYKVVFADTLSELMDEVTEMGRDNWVPQGGVSRAPLFGGIFAKRSFLQAMTKNAVDGHGTMSKSATPTTTG
ncbi:MAG: hypothetical protein ABJ327_04925 [Litoreibacter sp.]